MRRRVFNFAAAVSLVLCLISLEWWRTSYGMPRIFRLTASINRFYVFRSELGILELDRTDCYSGHLPPQFDKQFTIYQLPQGLSISWNPRCKSVFGFGYRNEPLILPMGSNLVIAATRSWSVPIWSFVVITSVLPLLFFHDARKRRRRRLSQCCERCGYNLTGNASGVCPECGDPVPQRNNSTEDRRTFGAIPERLRLLILAHVVASWAVGLVYTVLTLYFGRSFSIVRWSLELVFAPIWVFMSAVLEPIEIARRLSVAPAGFLTRVLLFTLVFVSTYVLTFLLTFRTLRARQMFPKPIASARLESKVPS